MTLLNSVWMLICATLVFVMQAGFLCLESGLTRSKNSINVAMKNLTDFSVSLMLFWAFGFAVMFGPTMNGLAGWGTTFPALSQNSLEFSAFFLFQVMFCATAATIVSGAVAERMQFGSYVVVTIVVSGFVYPLVGHWAWGSSTAGGAGWLENLGFVDFAGSTVVHGVGAWAALAAVIVIGPRLGRFDDDAKEISPGNLPMAMLGTLVLWLGWIGFNAGCTLEVNDQLAGIICNTLLSAAAGMLTAVLISNTIRSRPDVKFAINGSLSGLVAITAGCNAMTSSSAAATGCIAAALMVAADELLKRWRLDDAIGAIPVHGVAGVWGTLAVGVFGDPNILNTGLNQWEQLQAQTIGVASVFAFVFPSTWVVFHLVNRVAPMRVSAEDEAIGLNISEHGASTEVLDLVAEMESQLQSPDFTRRATVELNSECGPIAAQYNRVLDRVSEEVEKNAAMARAASQARRQAEQANEELRSRVNDLAEFNELAEGRELRMVELKQEINELLADNGQAERYIVDFEFAETATGPAASFVDSIPEELS